MNKKEVRGKLEKLYKEGEHEWVKVHAPTWIKEMGWSGTEMEKYALGIIDKLEKSRLLNIARGKARAEKLREKQAKEFTKEMARIEKIRGKDPRYLDEDKEREVTLTVRLVGINKMFGRFMGKAQVMVPCAYNLAKFLAKRNNTRAYVLCTQQLFTKEFDRNGNLVEA